jgi:hypothetical protein
VESLKSAADFLFLRPAVDLGQGAGLAFIHEAVGSPAHESETRGDAEV